MRDGLRKFAIIISAASYDFIVQYMQEFPQRVVALNLKNGRLYYTEVLVIREEKDG